MDWRLLETVRLLVAQHSVGLTSTCGSIGEDGCIFASDYGLDERFDSLLIDEF